MEQHETNQAALQRETYLAEVSHQLQSRLSPLAAYESVEELREHITAMAAAYEEIGMPSEDAMRLALQKFGAAEKIGSAIAETEPQGARPANVSIAIAPLWTGAVAFFSSVVMLKVVDIAFCLAKHSLYNQMPIWIAAEICLPVAVLVTPIAWLLRRRNPAVCGGTIAVALNALLIPTLYRTYVMLGRPNELLLIAVLLTSSTFVVGVVTAMAARWFDGRGSSTDAPGRTSTAR